MQLQKRASTQNPPEALENIWQQLLKQSALELQEGRQPTNSGLLVEETHVPLQQRVEVLHDWPSGVHGAEQAVAGAHSMVPVLFKSVQQPLSHCAPASHIV